MRLILANDIEIQKADKDFLNAVREKLTMINPKWIENQRAGRWNGNTPRILEYFMEDGDFAVPRGFLSELLSMCRKKPDILDLRRVQKPVSFTFNAEKRSYQQKAIDAMLSEDQGVLQASTGSGKTVMALAIIAARKQPTLIIVHTKELLYQWMDRIETFLGIPKEKIGQIGDGKKTLGKRITIGIVQSLYKCADQIFDRFGHLVVDECHRVASRVFDDTVSWFDCKYFLGLSATPYRRDKLTNLIHWFIGPTLYEIDNQEMIDRKAILPIEVLFRKTSFNTSYDPTLEYSKMISEMTQNEKRNTLIVEDAIQESMNGTALILSDRKSHCELLQKLCEDRGIRAIMLTGDVPTKERKKIVQTVNKGGVRIIIATGQLIGEGFDCKNLSSLFLATPIKYSGRLLQYLGRVLRPAKGKDKAYIYDYVDVYIRQMLGGMRHRKKVYEKEFNCHAEFF